MKAQINPLAGVCYFQIMETGLFQKLENLPASLRKPLAWVQGFLDYNRDGYLDVYVNNHVEETAFTYDSTGAINGFAHDCYPNFLYRNNGPTGGTGPITFSEVGADLGVNSLGLYAGNDSF